MEGDHWNGQRLRKPAITRRPTNEHVVWHSERIQKPSRRARLKATLIRVWREFRGGFLEFWK